MYFFENCSYILEFRTRGRNWKWFKTKHGQLFVYLNYFDVKGVFDGAGDYDFCYHIKKEVWYLFFENELKKMDK